MQLFVSFYLILGVKGEEGLENFWSVDLFWKVENKRKMSVTSWYLNYVPGALNQKLLHTFW